jgi:hypothetical protein
MIISIIFNVILLILLIISLIFLRKFVQYSILFEDNINESLKQLDNCYDNIEKLLDRPLLVDTPEVKFILNELRKSQNVIVDAADRITKESNDE